jgi:hypothetical protein
MKQLKNLAIERSTDEEVNRKVIEVLVEMGEKIHKDNTWPRFANIYLVCGFSFSYEWLGGGLESLKGRTKITASDFLSQYAPKEETELRVGMRVKSLVLNRMKHCPIGSVGTIMHRGNNLGVQFDSGKYGIYELEGSGLVPIQEEEKPVPCDVPQYEVKGFIKKLDPVIQNFYRLEWVKLDPDGELKPTNAGVVALNKVGLKCVDYKTVEDYAEAEVKRIEKEEKKSKK